MLQSVCVCRSVLDFIIYISSLAKSIALWSWLTYYFVFVPQWVRYSPLIITPYCDLLPSVAARHSNQLSNIVLRSCYSQLQLLCIVMSYLGYNWAFELFTCHVQRALGAYNYIKCAYSSFEQLWHLCTEGNATYTKLINHVSILQQCRILACHKNTLLFLAESSAKLLTP